jgi:hypothetical protein
VDSIGAFAGPAWSVLEHGFAPRDRQAELVPPPSGTASFAACSQLFKLYPLAVTPRSATAEQRSIVLVNRAAAHGRFYILTEVSDDLFVIRSWCPQDSSSQEIRPGEPVPDTIYRIIANAMPIPHVGALLGWVTDKRVTAILAVRRGRAAVFDRTVPVPEIRVMPRADTGDLLDSGELVQWPPFTARPLDDGRLWQYVEWGKIVDIVPLAAQSAGNAFWVPYSNRQSTRRDMGCVVVKEHMSADEYWLPAGVYLDHWALREGIPAPPASQLLSLPGTVDLASELR